MLYSDKHYSKIHTFRTNKKCKKALLEHELKNGFARAKLAQSSYLPVIVTISIHDGLWV
jgi:hypothetical protein